MSIDNRIDSLLAQMTLDEKIAQLGAVYAINLIDTALQFDPRRAATYLSNGIGQITRVGGGTLLPPVQTAAIANALQQYLRDQTRLGIPAIVHEECCSGYLAYGATTFPQAIGLAAMWQPNLVQAMAQVIRRQMRAVGAHHGLAPVLDVAQDPRWGRVEETFGEDPFLIARTGVAYIRGLQGDPVQGGSMPTGVVATGKHFVGQGAPAGGLNWGPVHVGERELREIHLYPFKVVIEEGGLRAIMNAYHEVDGIPLGAHRHLLRTVLRDELGFNGIVVSDYHTANNLVDYHHTATSYTDAAAKSINAGVDIELPELRTYKLLTEALDQGLIRLDVIDEAVQRILQLKADLGLFENPFVETGLIPAIYADQDAVQLSRELAAQSLVLLKNEGGLLPLAATIASLAVIGPCADAARLMQGDYHYPAHLEDIFNAQTHNPDSPNALFNQPNIKIADHLPPSITVLQGIRETVATGTQITYARGCGISDDDRSGFAEALAIASRADVIIAVFGDKSGLSKDSTSGESIDRAELGLPGVQQPLLEALVATGKPVILVLISGRAPVIPWAVDHVPAMLEGWLPAQEGGRSIAQALFGLVNPGGKLPMSVPRHVGQIPVYYNHKPSGGRSHWHGEYRDMTTQPLFPFGYGLSYTTFEFTDMQISAKEARESDTLAVSVTLRNSGTRAGSEVVQLYVHDVTGSVSRPVKQLAGFERVTLAPGESRRISFALPVSALAFYAQDMHYGVEPGMIEVLVGSSSADIKLQGSFEIVP